MKRKKNNKRRNWSLMQWIDWVQARDLGKVTFSRRRKTK